MDKINPQDRIYVPRKPRLGLSRPDYRWSDLAWLLTACAAVTGLVWVVLT